MVMTLHIAFLIACLVAAPAMVVAETTGPCSRLQHVAVWLSVGLASLLLTAALFTLLPWQISPAAAATAPFLCLVALDLGVCRLRRPKRGDSG